MKWNHKKEKDHAEMNAPVDDTYEGEKNQHKHNENQEASSRGREERRRAFLQKLKSPKTLGAAGVIAASVVAAVSVVAGAGFLKSGFDPSAYGQNSDASNDVAYDSTVFGANQNDTNGKEMDEKSQEDINLDSGEDPVEENQMPDDVIQLADNNNTDTNPSPDNNQNNTNNTGVQGVTQGDGSTPVVVVDNGNGTGGTGTGGTTPTPGGSGSGSVTPTVTPVVTPSATPATPTPTTTPNPTVTATPTPTPVEDEWELTRVDATQKEDSAVKNISLYQYMTLSETPIRNRTRVTATYSNKKDPTQTRTETVTDYTLSGIPEEYMNQEIKAADTGKSFLYTVSYQGMTSSMTCNLLTDFMVIQQFSITYNDNQKTAFCVGDNLASDAQTKLVNNIDITAKATTYSGHISATIYHFQKDDSFAVQFHDSTGNTESVVADKAVQTANLIYKDQINGANVTVNDLISYKVYNYRLTTMYDQSSILREIYQDTASFDLMSSADGVNSPYNEMIERLTQDGKYHFDAQGNPTNFFYGWSVYPNATADDYKSAITKYTFTTDHSRVLWPLPLKDIESDYVIRTEGNEQVLVGYRGSADKLEIPYGVTSLRINDSFEISAEASAKITSIVIPSTLHAIDFSALLTKFPNLSGFEVTDSSIYQADDQGAIYTNGGKTLLHLAPRCADVYETPYSETSGALSVTKIDEGAFDDAIAVKHQAGKNLMVVMSSPTPPELDLVEGCYRDLGNAGLRIRIMDTGDFDVTKDEALKYYAAAWGDALDRAYGTTGAALSSILYTESGAEKNYKNQGDMVYSQSGAVRTLEAAPVDAAADYTVDASITAIADYAFYHTTQMGMVTLPDSVTSLAAASFVTKDHGLKGVTVSGNQKITLGKKIAGEVSLNDGSGIIRFLVTTDQDTKSGWRTTFEKEYGKELTARMLIIGNETLEYIDSCIYLKNTDTQELTLISAPEGISTYQAPKGLTTIASHAFTGAKFTTLELPEVTDIAEHAFDRCDELELLVLSSPDKVTVDAALEECSALHYVLAYHANGLKVPDQAEIVSDSSYTEEGKILYQQVDEHQEVVYAATDVGGVVTLKDNTTVVQKQAFKDNSTLVGFSTEQWAMFTEIGEEAYAGCTKLTVQQETAESDETSQMDNGVLNLQAETIGARAFENCSGIMALNLNAGITAIGERAFSDCESLSSVVWLADTTEVGDYLFENCSRILTVDIGDEALEIDNVPVTTIGNHTFQNCQNMIYLNMHASIRNIGDYAFADCRLMRLRQDRFNAEVRASASVETVGAYAFKNCYKAAGNIVFNYSKMAVTFGEGAYMNCTSMGQVILPTRTKAISDYCFAGCKGMKLIYLYDDNQEIGKLESIGVAAFTGCTALQRVYNMSLCSELKEIGESAFGAYTMEDGTEYDSCESLISVSFPSSLEAIGTRAFEDNYTLENVEFQYATKLKTIGAYAFAGCEQIPEINIEPTKVEVLQEGVFTGCSKLSTLILPNTLTTIQKDAVDGCDSLSVIIARSQKVVKLEEGALGDVSEHEGLNIYVPYRENHEIMEEYLADPAWSEVLQDREDEIIQEIDDKTIIQDNGKYVQEEDGSFTLESVFPTTSGVFTMYQMTKKIAPDAFAGCDKLTMVIMPDDIPSIPDGVFGECSAMEALVMRQMDESIEGDAFTAPTLEGTLFGDGTANQNFRIFADKIYQDAYEGWGAPVYSYGSNYRIDSNVLYGRDYYESGDEYSELLYVPRSYEGTLVVYAGAENIVDSAMEGCDKLIGCQIQYNVRSIGKRAFANCSALEWVYIPNTTATRLTEIGEEAFLNCVSLEGRNATKLTQLTIPISIRKIGRAAFKNCTSLSYINIQGTLTEIADETFENCTSLTTYTGTVAALASVERIGKRAFYNCTSVTSLSWTNMANLKEVDDSAYEGCSNLFVATFADQLERIGDRAFMRTIMESISFNGATPPVLGADVMDPGLQENIKIFVPNGDTGSAVADAYRAAWGGSYPSIAANVQGLDGYVFRMVSNVLYLVNPSNSKELTAIRVPSVLSAATFYNATSLYCIGLGDGALRGCNQIAAITVTSNVGFIGVETFADCTALASVTISSNDLKTIGARAFLNCQALTELSLPASIISLGDGMLSGAGNMTSLTMASTIPPSLGEKVFGDAVPAAMKIYVPEASYDSYVERWGAILDRDYGAGTAARVLTYVGKPDTASITVMAEEATPTPTVTLAPTATVAPTTTAEPTETPTQGAVTQPTETVTETPTETPAGTPTETTPGETTPAETTPVPGEQSSETQEQDTSSSSTGSSSQEQVETSSVSIQMEE